MILNSKYENVTAQKTRYQCSRVIPTERDAALLGDLYAHVVMSIKQIRRRHFHEVKKCTALNRLARLEKGGLIRRTRVTNFRDAIGLHDVGTVFQITRSGISFLQSFLPKSSFRSQPCMINHSSLQHELIVNDVQWTLQKRFGGIDFVNGRLLNPTDDNNKKVPDVVGLLAPDRSEIGFPKSKVGSSDLTTMPITESKIAVEVELTCKSEKRYREIALDYQFTKKFDLVIYVTANDQIKMKVEEAITGSKPNLYYPRSTGKVFFVDLKDLLTNQDEAAITNNQDQFEAILENKTLTKEVA